jgi:hypothetical protein
VAIQVGATSPIVAEQVTYSGKKHDAATDTFGVPTAGKAWMFAAVDTLGSVEPNAQLGLVAASSYEFVALNRYSYDGGRGAGTSPGIIRVTVRLPPAPSQGQFLC